MSKLIDAAQEMVLDFCRGACGDHLCPGDIHTLAETQLMTTQEKKQMGFDTLFANAQCERKMASHLKTCRACRDLVRARRVMLAQKRRDIEAKASPT